jgi:hypothetical protein
MNDSPKDESRDLAMLAKVLPHMFARWRDWEDFETLAGLPDGIIAIDALAGTASHTPASHPTTASEAAGGAEAAPIRLRIAREIRSGLMDQLVRKEIQTSRIREAVLRIGLDSSQVKTDRNRIVHFDFHIAARIHAEAGVFEASQIEEHVWHDRTDRPGLNAL